MEEAKLWTGRQRCRGDEEEDDEGPGVAGGSETEACLGDGDDDEKPGVPSSVSELPIYVSMHRYVHRSSEYLVFSQIGIVKC